MPDDPLQHLRHRDGTLPARHMPGGWPVMYATDIGYLLCVECANTTGQVLAAYQVIDQFPCRCATCHRDVLPVSEE